jgi:hypothetical protein
MLEIRNRPRYAAADALDARADAEPDPRRSTSLHDDAYVARAHVRAADREVVRLRQQLRCSSRTPTA